MLLAACAPAARDPQAPAPRASTPVAALTPSPSPSPAPKAPGRVYTRADLDALRKAAAWSELVEHLEDVAPADRDADWTALTITAVVEHLSAENKTDRPRPELARVAEGFAARYPAVRTASAFVALRADLAAAALEACANDQGPRKDRAERMERCTSFVPAAAVDAPRAIKAAEVVRRHGAGALAMALYRAASDTDAKRVCASDAALTVVMEGRGSPPSSPFYEDANVVLERCRKVKER